MYLRKLLLSTILFSTLSTMSAEAQTADNIQPQSAPTYNALSYYWDDATNSWIRLRGSSGGFESVILPAPLRGQGVFTASTSSTAVNAALSLAPRSGAFPTGALGGTITIKPKYTATVGISVCWQGGTCTVAVGEYLAPGESSTQNLSLQNMTDFPPTVISTGTPDVNVRW